MLNGIDIIIWTCRKGVALANALDFLDQHNIPYTLANSNIGNDFTSRKIFADIYIDDHSLGHLPPWQEIPSLVYKQLGMED